MNLFVSKLSIRKAGNPTGKILYSRPCEFYDEKYEDEDYLEDDEVEIFEEDGEEEEYEDDDDDIMGILIDEFRDGRLRQGWGWEYDEYSLDLQDGVGSFRDKNGRIQPTKKWVCDFMHLYDKSQKKAVGRFRILSKLLDMENGDIVFVPNIPSEDMFSVATVDGGYEFALMEEYDEFGHIIHVRDVKEYYYGDDTLPKKLWSFPPAVVRIRKNEKFREFLKKSYFK